MSRQPSWVHAACGQPEWPGCSAQCEQPQHLERPESQTHSERLNHPDNPERGAGTILALGLGLLVVLAAVLIALLAQSAAMATRAAAAADLAALAAADAARGIIPGDPCVVAADVARRNNARVLSCSEGAGSTVQVRTELEVRTPVGGATGLARAGPPREPAAAAGTMPAALSRPGPAARCASGPSRP